MPTILVASLYFEGNHFSNSVARKENFAMVEGQAVLDKAAISKAALGGAYRCFKQHNVNIVPLFTAQAAPGGHVLDEVYSEFREAIIAAATAAHYDGIYLDVHGSMVTQSIDDIEGDLLQHLRQAVGSAVVIGASLDLHAYVTRKMLNAADIIVACKENPHTDYDLAGQRVAELMLATLAGDIKPVTAAVWVPLLLSGRTETAVNPLARLHTLRRKLLSDNKGLLDISLCNQHMLLDVPNGGQCITVIADGDANAEQAGQAASTLAAAVWQARDEFTPDALALDSVLEQIEKGELQAPVICGDCGDSVLGGAPGDDTTILVEVLNHRPSLTALIPITDPDVVERACELGVGQRYLGSVGGQLSTGLTPVAGDWQIQSIGDGDFINIGPFCANEPASLGQTVVLEKDNITLMVTSRPGLTQDPAAFISQGLDPSLFDIVVVKSAVHFKASFAATGTCIAVATAGCAFYNGPGVFPFKKLGAIYPEVTDLNPELTPAYY